MRRNPTETKKKQYFKNIKFRKIKPRFIWHTCTKCKNEFRNETMFECTEPSIMNFNWNYTKYGCSHCFQNQKEFETFMRETILCTEQDFDTESLRILR